MEKVKDNKGRFVVKFPLKVEKWQEDIIEKRFRIGEHVYNETLAIALKSYFELAKRKDYRFLQNRLEELNQQTRNDADKMALQDLREDRKEVIKQIYKMQQNQGLSEFGLMEIARAYAKKYYKKDINSTLAQQLAKQVWSAMQKKIADPDNTELHYKRRGQLNSLTGCNNATGIRLLGDIDHMYVLWKPLIVPIKASSYYQKDALQNAIAYCKIKREKIKGKWHYYLQVTMKGNVPTIYDKDGNDKRKLGKGKVGIYFQSDKVTVATANSCKTYKLTKIAYDEKVKETQRKMDASRRATNPQNYNENGTIKMPKEGEQLHWYYSERYKKLRTLLYDYERKQSQIRLIEQEKLANEIIRLGNEFVYNDIDFKFLQMNVGKKTQNSSPAQLKDIIKRKLGYHDVEMQGISYKDLNPILEKKNIEKKESEKVAKLLLKI